MSLVLSALVPSFGIMIFGAIAKKMKLIGHDSKNIIENYVLNCALPCMIFVIIEKTPLNELFELNFLISMIIAIILTYGLTYLISYYKSKSIGISAMRAVIITFPNVAFMGIAVTMALFGDKGLIPFITVNILMIFVICITLVLIEINRGDSRISIKNSMLIFLKQPVLIACAAGIFISVFNIRLPSPVISIFSNIGMTTGPCALFVLGTSLISFKMKYVTAEIFNICFLRLIAVPILIIFIMKMFKVSSSFAGAGLILLALPPAILNYIFSKKGKVYITETSSILVISCILSFLTLSGLIFALPYLWPDIKFVVSH